MTTNISDKIKKNLIRAIKRRKPDVSLGMAISLCIHLVVIGLLLINLPTINANSQAKKVPQSYIIAEIADKINVPKSISQPEIKKQPEQTKVKQDKVIPQKQQIDKENTKAKQEKQLAPNNETSKLSKQAPRPKQEEKKIQETGATAKKAISKDEEKKSSQAKAPKAQNKELNDKADQGKSALKSINTSKEKQPSNQAKAKSENNKSKDNANTSKAGTKKVAENNKMNSLFDELDDGDYDEDKPLSTTEMNLIMAKIHRSWNVTSFSGGANANRTTVMLLVRLSITGEVISVQPKINYSLNNQRIYNAMLKSAIRAVHDAGPFSELPKNKYKTWQSLEILFDPADML